MDDNVNQIIEDRADGVIISDKTELETMSTSDNNITTTKRRADNFPDAKWSLEKQVERKNLFSEIQWDATASQGQILASYNVLSEILVNDISTNPFQEYVYMNFESIKIHINLMGNKFFAGQLYVFFYPTQTPLSQTSLSGDMDLTKAVTMDGIYLQATSDTSAEFSIGYRYFKDWIDLTQADTLGQLVVMVVNPYRAATGSPPNINLKMWMSVHGSKFMIPRVQNTATLLRRGLIQNAPLRIQRHSGLLALAAKTLAPVAKEILPDQLHGGIDLIGSLLDKPQISENPQMVNNKSQGFLSHSVNNDFIDSLSLKPDAIQACDTEHFGVDFDEMDMRHLVRNKKGFMKTINISTTDAKGTLLFTTWVGPNGYHQFDNPNPIRALPIDYFAANHNMWRGGIKYIFNFVVSKFHEMRVDIVLLVGLKGSAIPREDAITQYVITQVIREGENNFEVTIPFFSPTPYKTVYNGTETNDNPFLQNGVNFSDFFVGTLNMYVSNPLVAPQVVSSQVECNVFQAAADDFELNILNFDGDYMAVQKPYLVTQRSQKHEEAFEVIPRKSIFIERHAATYDMNKLPSQQSGVSLNNDSRPLIEPEPKHFGETNMSLREACKRYSPAGRYQASVNGLPAALISAINAGLRPFIYTFPLNGISGFMERVRPIYRNVRGSDCIKVRVTSPTTDRGFHGWVSFLKRPYNDYPIPSNAQLLARQFPHVNSGSVLIPPTDSNNVPRAYFDESQVAEAKLPYISQFPVSVISQRFDNVADKVGLSTIVGAFDYNLVVVAIYSDWNTNPPEQAIFNIDVDYAFGDEKHMSTFIGLPMVKYDKNGFPYA